jgi:hypothetical protein
LLIREDAYAVGRRLCAQLGALLGSLLAVDPRTDQGTDFAAELNRLILTEAAEMLHLDLAIRVLVDRERIDHAGRCLRHAAAQLGDDLAMRSGCLEPTAIS